MIPSHPRTPSAPPPAAASLRRCRDCAGWDGGDADLGPCVIRARTVAADAVACPHFFRQPIVRVH